MHQIWFNYTTFLHISARIIVKFLNLKLNLTFIDLDSVGWPLITLRRKKCWITFYRAGALATKQLYTHEDVNRIIFFSIKSTSSGCCWSITWQNILLEHGVSAQNCGFIKPPSLSDFDFDTSEDIWSSSSASKRLLLLLVLLWLASFELASAGFSKRNTIFSVSCKLLGSCRFLMLSTGLKNLPMAAAPSPSAAPPATKPTRFL